MSVRIAGAGGCGRGEIVGGGVVDRIYPDGSTPDPRAQCVDECLSGWTKTGVLGGAAGEYHLDVGARLRGRGRSVVRSAASPRLSPPRHPANERIGVRSQGPLALAVQQHSRAWLAFGKTATTH